MAIGGTLTVWVTRQQMLADWHRCMELYGHPIPAFIMPKPLSKPRWGQPGRHRRRKNRQAARALEAIRRGRS